MLGKQGVTWCYCSSYGNLKVFCNADIRGAARVLWHLCEAGRLAKAGQKLKLQLLHPAVA